MFLKIWSSAHQPTPALPGNQLEMQILGPYPIATESETLGVTQQSEFSTSPPHGSEDTTV